MADDLSTFKAHVDVRLRQHRPDRYEPGADWLESLAADLADEVPIAEARRYAAREVVLAREREATKKVNRFLLRMEGTLPLGWFGYADEPVAFEVMENDPETGTPVSRRVRVALRAMRPEDWHRFATEGRIAAQHRFDAEMRVYETADLIAAEQGARAFAEWAAEVAPFDAEESA